MQPYEACFSAKFGAEYNAFSFWKGRVALYAILKAMDLQEKDEVILPGYTCVVVPNAIRFAGAKPVYADIAPGSFNLDPASVRRKVTSRTRVLVVQHTYGIPANIGALRAIANEYGLGIIEDCAHVLVGASYQGELLGTFGKAAFFSSQWSKPYTTGLGGIVVTHDQGLAKRLEEIQATFQGPPLRQRFQLQIQYALYRRFFKPKTYWFSQKTLHALSKFGLFVGSSNPTELNGVVPSDICWKMSNLQQRAGLAQIEMLEENSAHRQRLTGYYSEIFHRHRWPVYDQLEAGETRLLRFPLMTANKTQILKESSRRGIEIGSWFETPLHPLPLGSHHLVNYQMGSCPVAESTAARTINLPLHERVTRTDAEKIAHFVLAQASPISSPLRCGSGISEKLSRGEQGLT